MKMIWKRTVGLVLALALALGSLTALAAEPAGGSEIVEGTYWYTSNGGSGIQESDSFVWRDDCFTRSSYLGCAHLRLLSAQVSIASASYYGAEPDVYERDCSDAGRNIRNMLTDMGFEDVETNTYYQVQPLEQSTAVALGHKTLLVGDQEYTLLAVIPRGAGYKQEWAGNFTVGSDGIHAGFKAGRDEALRFVKTYLQRHEITGALKVWITGHSRGSGIANLLGGFFAGGGVAYFGEGVSLTPEDVYCYCFASPKTVIAGLDRSVELSVAGDRDGAYAGLDTPQAAWEFTGGGTLDPAAAQYGGIRNYPFSHDFITHLPPEGWGYTNYGVFESMNVIDGTEIDPDDMAAELAAVSPFAWEKWMNGGDPREFQSMDFDLAELAVVPLDSGASGAAGMTEFISARIAGLMSRVSHEGYTQEGYQDTMIAFTGINGMIATQFEDEIAEELGALIKPAVLSYLAYASKCLRAEGRAESETEAVTIALVELIDHFTGETHDPAALTVDEFFLSVLTYLAERTDSPLAAALIGLIDEETALMLTELFSAFIPGLFPDDEDYDEKLARVSVGEALSYVLNAAVYGADPESIWGMDEDMNSAEKVRSTLYLLIPFASEELYELYFALEDHGSHPLTELVASILTLLLRETDEEGEVIRVYPSAAKAADAGLLAAFSSIVESVAAKMSSRQLYDERFAADLRRHAEALLQPERIAQLRGLLLVFLFGGGEAPFSTARNVENVATFFGNIGMIPPAHYNEVFIAWGKAAVKLSPGTPISLTVSIESWTSGEPAARPVLSGNPGSGAVTYTYARSGSERYSETVPTAPGSYTVKATVAPTHDYAGGTASADFEIRSGKPIGVGPGYAEPEPVSEPVRLSFADVQEDAWYAAAVRWAVERGVTEGTDETHFSPDAACTRAQAVTFLWRAAGSPEPTQAETPFTDVAAGSYYEKAVSWAVENGIVNGTSETTFSPDKTVTRAQAVAFLYRYAKAETEPVKVFEDVDPEAWYAGAVTWAAEQEIALGASGTAFSPDADCVRGQIVSFLHRLFA